MNDFYVYIYRDPRKNNEPIYVGKGKGDRSHYHLRYKYKSNPILQNKLKKIIPIVEIYRNNLSEAQAFKIEKELIQKYGRYDLGEGTLCNLTDGGEGVAGLVQTEEHRRKNGLANMGTYEERYGKETAERLRKNRREQMLGNQHGKNITNEGRRKISETHKGKTWEERFGEEGKKSRTPCYLILDPDKSQYIVFTTKKLREFAACKGLPKTSLQSLSWSAIKKDNWNGWYCKRIGTELEFDKTLKTIYSKAIVYR